MRRDRQNWIPSSEIALVMLLILLGGQHPTPLVPTVYISNILKQVSMKDLLKGFQVGSFPELGGVVDRCGGVYWAKPAILIVQILGRVHLFVLDIPQGSSAFGACCRGYHCLYILENAVSWLSLYKRSDFFPVLLTFILSPSAKTTTWL